MAGKYDLFKFTVCSVLLILSAVAAKKARKSKKQKVTFDEYSQLQPDDDVDYTSFGFDDVVGHDGFVPRLPDHIDYLSNVNKKGSGTGFYVPAFPTAFDMTGNEEFPNNHEYNNGNKFKPVESDVLYEIQNNAFDHMIPQSNTDITDIENNEEINYQNQHSHTIIPEYGTRIPPKTNIKFLDANNFSHALFNQDLKLIGIQNAKQIQEPDIKLFPLYDSKGNKNMKDFNSNWNSNYNLMTADAHPTEYKKNESFSKTIGFMKNQLLNPFQSNFKDQFQNHNSQLESKAEDIYNNVISKHKNGHYNFSNNNFLFNSYDYDYKPTTQRSYSNPKRYNKTSLPTLNETFNQMYSKTNYNPNPTTRKSYFKSVYKRKNNTSKYHHIHPKTAFDNIANHDYNSPEHVVTEFTDHGNSDKIFSVFEDEYHNRIPGHKKLQSTIDYYSLINPQNDPDNANQEDILFIPKPIKNTKLYNPDQIISTQWDNKFKVSNSGSSFKQSFKTFKGYGDPENVVYIPKRGQRNKSIQKHIVEPTNNWNTHSNYTPLKIWHAQPVDEWNKEVFDRFKSEEELLGLRNRDTSHPSYLPSLNLDSFGGNFHDYKPTNDYMDATESLRQSYLRSKRPKHMEREKSPSENLPVPMPIPKHYPFEAPHPIIVAVPQPYPVQVPVPKPVAVPVVQEVKVPIDKPVPCPVVKKVHYPIEKLVPVPVAKEVAVKVIKPYPVPVPRVRPVSHHSNKPIYNEDYVYDDHDYEQEHEEYQSPRIHKGYWTRKKTIIKLKKPKSPRGYRPHRSLPLYREDRNQRRWAAHKLSAKDSRYTKPNHPPHRVNPSDNLNLENYYNIH